MEQDPYSNMEPDPDRQQNSRIRTADPDWQQDVVADPQHHSKFSTTHILRLPNFVRIIFEKKSKIHVIRF
jgi:hypothetical protein